MFLHIFKISFFLVLVLKILGAIVAVVIPLPSIFDNFGVEFEFHVYDCYFYFQFFLVVYDHFMSVTGFLSIKYLNVIRLL